MVARGKFPCPAKVETIMRAVEAAGMTAILSSEKMTPLSTRPVRFKVHGLNCPNEVRALQMAVAPIVGDASRLSFDAKAGLMEVASGHRVSPETIKGAVRTTGMTAELLHGGMTMKKPLRPPMRTVLFAADARGLMIALAVLLEHFGNAFISEHISLR